MLCMQVRLEFPWIGQFLASHLAFHLTLIILLFSLYFPDYDAGLNFTSFPPYTGSIEATPKVLAEAYEKQLQNPAYASFLRNSNNITVFGTYDDHDYGVNNGDKTYKHAKHAAVAFLKFTGESKASPMYKRAERGYGLYGVKMFDFSRPAGQELVSDEEAAIDPDVVVSRNISSRRYLRKTVAIFVLDCRTNKTPWRKTSPDYEGDMLGERQWQWFEAAIKNSRAEVNVIVNGLQVHPDVRLPDPNIYERWGAFPSARQRLYDAILQEGVKAPLLISGDVHMSQLMRKDCYKWDPVSYRMLPATYRRSLIELTTSGMTHSW
jgi:alkaline phosphatase D